MSMNGYVTLASNAGGGFGEKVRITEGMTAGELFQSQHSGCDPDGYQIRVNGEQVTKEQLLEDGDHVSISPLNIKGGRM